MPETVQQYIQRILGHVEGKDPLRALRDAPKKLATLIKGVDKKRLARKPAPGKWSVAEILAHLADSEIVGAWRFRQVISSNGIALQPYDQNVWAETFNYAHSDPRQSLETFTVVRSSNLALLKTLPRQLWENYGMHQERGKETLAHLVRLYAGHDLNHIGQIERIVAEGKAKKRRR